MTPPAAAPDSPENPPSLPVQIFADKAATDGGFRLRLGADGPWRRYGSTTAPGDVWVAGRPPAGPWWLAPAHPGVAAALGPPDALPGPGAARIHCPDLPALHAALHRAWHLARSLPATLLAPPFSEFQASAAGLPRTTEAERLVVQRIGQDVFRRVLLAFWGGRCPLTGITDLALLRASHIVPWAACRDDAQRLDVHNGLLLSALWDAAFDAGLVSFRDDGTLLLAPGLSAAAVAVLVQDAPAGGPTLAGLLPAHGVNLRDHRARHGFPDEGGAKLPLEGGMFRQPEFP